MTTVYCQQHPLEVAYDDNVCNANDVKAHSHRGDINEVSCQFIAVLVVSTIHFSRGDVNGL